VVVLTVVLVTTPVVAFVTFTVVIVTVAELEKFVTENATWHEQKESGSLS